MPVTPKLIDGKRVDVEGTVEAIKKELETNNEV
jgi:hypothetical protein